MSKISIIVPIYKVPETYLRHCIESCINQTLKDIEIILVDDGSPDDCGRICDEYAESDSRIRVIHKENGGLVSARNAGFDVVSSPWHMYLDGDDWIDNDTCYHLYNSVLKNGDVDVIFWKYIIELGNQSIKGKFEWQCNDSERVYSDSECRFLSLNTLIYKSGIATAYCKLIRTDYARQNCLFHNSSLKQGAEGMEFSLRVFYYAKKSLFINAYWNHYIYNSDSISKKVNEQNTKYLTDCLKVILYDIDSFEDKVKFKQALYQRTLYIILAMAMNTYFHPDNQDSLSLRISKFKDVINGFELYKESIKFASTEGMDKQRKIALFFIRMKMFFLLDIMGKAKQFLLKRGKYNY